MEKQTYYSPTDLKYYNSQISDDEYFKNISPGYVFHPSDAQLIVDYLIPKIKNEKLPRCLIKVVNDIYNLNPEKLADDYGVNRAEEWFFFIPKDREYQNENIRNGVAVDGYWQVIGDDETIQNNDQTLGFRKTFEFYKGNPPSGDETSWIMHEIRANYQYIVADDDLRLDDWIVCRVYHKENRWKEEIWSDTDDVIWNDDQEDVMCANGGDNNDDSDLSSLFTLV
ncbi:NAC transcription factor 29 [Forsythia ovata]|uniref:NAC transcription factor 29 n=1 Tax=Forsythia ovata TaxID=205694 RepID=A0ABD1PL52_9LAMI